MVPNVHFPIDSSPSLDLIVHHMSLVYAIVQHLFKLNFSIILVSVSILRTLCAAFIVVI
jgi:hypothetical protein